MWVNNIMNKKDINRLQLLAEQILEGQIADNLRREIEQYKKTDVNDDQLIRKAIKDMGLVPKSKYSGTINQGVVTSVNVDGVTYKVNYQPQQLPTPHNPVKSNNTVRQGADFYTTPDF